MQVAVNAQTTKSASTPTVRYSYDASGNRVQRQLIVPIPFALVNNNIADTTVTDDINNIIAANNQTLIKEGSAGITTITEGDIKVFPNPVQSNLNVHFTGNAIAEGCTMQIYDGSGKIFYQAAAAKNQTQINMSQAKVGIYYMVVVTKDGKRLWWKVSKG